MIKHEHGDEIPPTNKQLWIIEWMSRGPGETKPTSKTVMVPPGMGVREGLRGEYWCARKMHEEFAAVCRRARVALPNLFMIMIPNTLVGYGSYANEDAHYRGFVDCVIREAEWECRGRNELPMIGMDLASAGVPEAELTALSQRTGAPTMGIG
jgi:hypothetical protein